MFKTMKELFTSGNKDLRHRIYFTLVALTIFILGISIRVPGTENLTKNLGFLELINTIGGGALKNFSIFALGVMPYITASIIMQLLQLDIIPYFSELKEEGYTGRQKINKITRYLAIIFAFAQSYALCIMYNKTLGLSPMEMMATAVVMTAGTSFCLWLGDEITKKGIGNGSSMIILAGILFSMPRVFVNAYNGLNIFMFILFVIVYILVLVGVIYTQLAERRIPIQYANRTNSAYGGEQSYLPIKLNSAGVIPVIFAQIILSIPSTIAALFKSDAAVAFMNKWIVPTSNTGMILYLILIFFFGYLKI